MNITPRRLVLALCSVPLIGAGAAAAQGYPTKPIRIIVPYAPGGSTDVVFRILAPRLTEILGQPVVVENRPGGSSSIGLDIAAKSPPDGHTLGIPNITFGANPSLMKKMPFDTEKDFVPVSLVSIVTLVVAFHPSVPARSVKALIALAKARPGSLNYGSAGNASANHLATERFSYAAGIKMVHIPYKGGGPAVISIVGGETAILFATIPSSIQHFQSGKLVALAVSSLKRNVALPDVPSKPGRHPGFSDRMERRQSALERPANDRLNLAKALSIPEVRERIIGLADRWSAANFTFKKEIATWATVIKEVGITVE